ncbi:MAG: hypothetical protein HKL95_07635 [Phycisphaerae bacterium]|nr:hypothetical protein [Phycisphaerae bacterium]
MSLPILVGFNDAPVAERPSLTTIAIRWTGLAHAVVAPARRRMDHGHSGSLRQVLTPRPVVLWQ